MNCQGTQREITESFAAGGSILSSKISAHLEVCGTCRDFYSAQQKLFRSLEDGLRVLVNQPVPPSLLPRVRAGLDEAPVASRTWLPGWGVAVLASALVLAVILPYTLRRPQPPAKAREKAQTVSLAARSSENPPANGYSTKGIDPGPAIRKRGASRPATSSSQIPPATPEVIVLAEERQAFARFVAQIPQEREVALALTNPAPPAKDVPVEVALLEIRELRVPPLGATEAE